MPPRWGAEVAAELLGSAGLGWAPWLAGERLRVRGRGRCGSRAPEMLQPPQGRGPALGGHGRARLLLRGDGGSTSAPRSTPGHNSHGDEGLATGRAGGGSRVSPALRSSGDQPRERVPPSPCLGTLSRHSGEQRRSLPLLPVPAGKAGNAGGSGEPSTARANCGNLSPFPPGCEGQTPQSTGSCQPRGRLFRCGAQWPQSAAFHSQNERRGQVGSGTMPEGAPRPWDTGGDISAPFAAVVPCQGTGARVWFCPGREVRGAERVRVRVSVCVFVCVSCVFVCVCVCSPCPSLPPATPPPGGEGRRRWEGGAPTARLAPAAPVSPPTSGRSLITN